MFDIYWGQFKYLFIEQINGIYYSDLMILIILAALVVFVPGYVLHIKKGVPFSRIFLAFLTVAYLGVMLLITIFRRDPGSRSATISLWINLGIAGRNVYSVRQVIYSFMNVALFVPWGILIALHRTDQTFSKIIVMTTLIGFITSSLIEVIQLFTGTGKFELTDLITNVAGTFIGALIIGVGVIIKRMARK